MNWVVVNLYAGQIERFASLRRLAQQWCGAKPSISLEEEIAPLIPGDMYALDSNTTIFVVNA
jgi:hypothetical protein